MSISTSTIIFTHRFVGPCRAKDLQPYARPDILSVQLTNEEDGTLESISHIVIRYGRIGDGQVCLELKSERDEDLYGFWNGTKAELMFMIQQETQKLFLWNLTILISSRMMRSLLL